MATPMLARRTVDDDRPGHANGAGNPKDWAVLSTIGWLPSAPAATPAIDPTTTGSMICARRTPATWAGVNPTAFITPMSR